MNIEPSDLDRDSQRKLAGNVAIGEACIIVAAGSTPMHDDDREAYAGDAVVNILTAVYGAAGHCEPQPEKVPAVLYDEDAAQEARDFLDRCYRAWVGDAEDYGKADPVDACPNCGRPFDGRKHAGDPCDVCNASEDGMADPGRARRNTGA